MITQDIFSQNFDPYELCPCGSNLKFKFCCYQKAREAKYSKKKQDKIPLGKINHMMIKSWEQSDFKTCLAFNSEECSGDIKGAHSIQNNRILNRISDKGHIYCINGRATETGLKSEFKKISKNKASTFFGFCDFHDTDLFKPIEINEYTQEPIQDFLFAFRAHSLEFHRKQRLLDKFRKLFLEYPSALLDGMYVNAYRVATLDVQDYSKDHSIFRENYIGKTYSCIRSIYRKLDYEVNFATCSAFTVEYDLKSNILNDIYNDKSDNRMPSIYVTVYPIDGGTNIILSYFMDDEEIYGDYFMQLESLSTEQLADYLNYLIIEYTENVFFNPVFIESMTLTQRESILRSFSSSIQLHEKFELGLAGNYYNFNIFRQENN